MARAMLALWRSRWSTIVSMTHLRLLRGVGAVEVDQRQPVREHALEDGEVLADDLQLGQQAPGSRVTGQVGVVRIVRPPTRP